MADIFISYVDDDAELAGVVAAVIEGAGYATWYHERDSIPGPPFRTQVDQALDAAKAVVVIISDASMQSKQVTYEIGRAHESATLFIPILHGVTERELRTRRRDWRDCFGDATSIPIRRGADGVTEIRHRMIAGFRAVGIEPQHGETSPPTAEPSSRAGAAHEASPHKNRSTADHDEVLDILDTLLDRSHVAKAPDDVRAAINQGFADVDRALADIASDQEPLDLADVDRVTGVAIRHGAGIYNHSQFGRVGCGRIYHHAAAGLLAVAEQRAPASGAEPPTNAGLAVDWLNRIVEATPRVTPPIADEVAWELRFAFDSIPLIPLCDQVHNALVQARSQEHSLRVMCSIILRLIEHSNAPGRPHVQAYLLRHTAELVVRHMPDESLADRGCRAARDRLAAVVKSHPRITRENTAQLTTSLLKQFSELCASAEDQGRIERTAATNPEVFISAKNEDYEFAEQVYDFLMSHGVATFFSKVSLPETGNSEYQKQIDHALDACKHMIVVTSSIANVNSSWVEAEWRLFINEKRSGNKTGNLVSVVVGDLKPRDLPASLRFYAVIPFKPQLLAQILPYVER